MGALSNKGGRAQRNREEIGAGVIIFIAASPLVRPARQNRHATQAKLSMTLYTSSSLPLMLFSKFVEFLA